MTQEEIAAELSRCKKLLKIREGRAGYTANVEAIKARMTELQAMTPDDAPPDAD